MRLLYLTDTHIRGTTPQNRRDNFPEALKAKLREVVRLANELEVHAVLHGGDFFDLPNPTLQVCAEFLEILRGLEAPLYVVAGNHDLFGQNPESLGRTMLGFLARLGWLRLLAPGEPVYLEAEGVRVQLTGQHFHYDLDRRDPVHDYVVRKRSCDVAIHMVHGMLVERPFFPGACCTLVERIAATEADYTLSGHAHLGFGDICLDGRYFINPGALARLTVLPGELERTPQVVLLDFGGPAPHHRRIPLASAAPGREVLDRSRLLVSAFREEKLARFVQVVRESGGLEALALDQIIAAIAERHGVEEEVRQEALRRLTLAHETLAAGEGESRVRETGNH